jgi:hypothetical protein
VEHDCTTPIKCCTNIKINVDRTKKEKWGNLHAHWINEITRRGRPSFRIILVVKIKRPTSILFSSTKHYYKDRQGISKLYGISNHR